MHLTKLYIKNYRSIQEMELNFLSKYTTISGRNNAGKSNIIQAIITLFRPVDDDEFYYEEVGIDWDTDVPVWLSKVDDVEIILEAEFYLYTKTDMGLIEYIEKFLQQDKIENAVLVNVRMTCTVKDKKRTFAVTINSKKIDEYKSTEFMKKIGVLRPLYFHDSIENNYPHSYRRSIGSIIGSFDAESKNAIGKKTQSFQKLLSRKMKEKKSELVDIFSRLEDKFNIEISIPGLDIERTPVEIALSHKGHSMNLRGWGSGTRNRTNILLNIVMAKRRSEANTSVSLQPIMVIEEPESFLHPSAQAEFSLILQDLATESGIQIITTTHNPYLLSHKDQKSNILIDREKDGDHWISKKCDTEGDGWIKPFELVLGISSPELYGIKGAFFGGSNCVILVEGEIDKAYLDELRRDSHGASQLKYTGEIFSYDGVDNLRNQIFLKFLVGKFSRLLILMDIDRMEDFRNNFEKLGMKENKNFIGVGKSEVGKKNIEGYLPNSFRSEVYSENADLVTRATTNDSHTDSKQAKRELKAALLRKFIGKAKVENGDYCEFYELTRRINKALMKTN